MKRTAIWLTMAVALLLMAATTRAAGRRPGLIDYEEAEQAYQKGDYNQALPLLMEYMEDSVAEEQQHPEELMKAYYHAGDVHYYYSDFVGAIDYFVRGYQLSVRKKHAENEEKFLNNICAAYIMMGRHDMALDYCERIRQSTGLKTPAYEYDYNYLKGCILLSKEKPEEALPYARRAVDIALQNGFSPREVGQAYRAVSDYFRYYGRMDSTIAYLHKVEEWMGRTTNRWSQIGCMRSLMQAYAQQGDYARAMDYQRRYLQAQDSLMNVREFNQIRSMHEQADRQKQDKHIKELAFQVRYHRIIALAALAILTVVVVFLVVVFRQKSRLEEAYHAVFERNKELTEYEKTAPPPAPVKEKPADSSGLPTAAAEDLYHRILFVMENPDRYCDPEFGLVQLTQAVGSNVNYVSKVIHDKSGDNVRAFINGYRIREARRRMTDVEHYGNLTLQAIAESVGYDTQTTFNRTFKRLTGITPSLYQKLAREGHEMPETP